MDTRLPKSLMKRLLVGLFLVGALFQNVQPQVAYGADPQVTLDVPTISPVYNNEELCDSGWYRFENALDDYAYLALNTNDISTSIHQAEWRPEILESGFYKVEVYIPSHGTIDWDCPEKQILEDTQAAQYTVYHALGQSSVAVDQSALGDEWFSLGEFAFRAGSQGHVNLTNLTTDTNQSRTVSFSAMRFTWVRSAPSIVYIPVLNAGPRVKLTSVWTADSTGAARTAFVPGEEIRFYATGFNITGSEAIATFTWSQEGPCGTFFTADGNMTLDVETWTTYKSITAPDCKGIHVFTLQINYQGQSDTLSVMFLINNPSATLTSTRQAFDRCNIPTVGQMQNWWTGSPYYSVNLYIGGISRACENLELDAFWVYQVGQQGWSFIPTWVGPQAPCSGLRYRMSSTAAVAYQQGRNEADAAADAVTNLGFIDSSVIYYDLEGYSYYSYGGASQGCRDTVKSFINGWVERLHELGIQAGVYGGSCSSYLSDLATINSPPDQIWFARWKKPYAYDPYASVWGDSCISDSLWSSHQRIRQYAGDHTETWGGVALRIDSNVVDGAVTTVAQAPQAALNESRLETPAIDRSQIREAQLLTSGLGWALVDDHIYWTQDAGGSWQDITPAEAASASLLSAFFLEERQGWLIAGDPETGQLSVLTAMQGDSGWQSSPLEDGAEVLASDVSDAFLSFVDPQTGWVVLKLNSSSNFSVGLLYKTTDGGRTWERLDLPVGDPVRFIDRQRGWVAGGPAGDELYRTSDGGRTWQPQEIVAKETYTPGQLFIGLPQFKNERSGLLPVTFADPDNPRVDLYTTFDGGDTWELASTLPLNPGTMPGAPALFDLTETGHGVLAPTSQESQDLVLDAGVEVAENEQVQLPEGTVWFEFADRNLGWAQVQSGTCSGAKPGSSEAQPAQGEDFQCEMRSLLLRTSDGGHTWEPVTPASSAGP